MTIETLLERVPVDMATIRMLDKQLEGLRYDIIHSSGGGLGERVQSSNRGDSTSDKAIEIVSTTENLKRHKTKLQSRVNAVQNGLGVLTVEEYAVINLRYFKGSNLSDIESETGLHIRTIHRRLKSAKDKIQPHVKEFLI